jgi:hypothetical protein
VPRPSSVTTNHADAAGTDLDLVHYKTSVSLLHLVIGAYPYVWACPCVRAEGGLGGTEKAAADADPRWERAEHQSVRDYLAMLAEQVPLDGAAVAQFVALYEKARFSDAELTLDEYARAMRAFVTLAQVYVVALVVLMAQKVA